MLLLLVKFSLMFVFVKHLIMYKRGSIRFRAYALVAFVAFCIILIGELNESMKCFFFWFFVFVFGNQFQTLLLLLLLLVAPLVSNCNLYINDIIFFFVKKKQLSIGFGSS